MNFTKKRGALDTWNEYLQYLRDWADSHGEPGFYGMTPACFDEWLDCEHCEDEADDVAEIAAV